MSGKEKELINEEFNLLNYYCVLIFKVITVYIKQLGNDQIDPKRVWPTSRPPPNLGKSICILYYNFYRRGHINRSAGKFRRTCDCIFRLGGYRRTHSLFHSDASFVWPLFRNKLKDFRAQGRRDAPLVSRAGGIDGVPHHPRNLILEKAHVSRDRQFELPLIITES